MAFPDDDLEVTVEAAFGADTTTAPWTWTWTDLSGLLLPEPITINRGVLVGQGSHRSASATLNLLNGDGSSIAKGALTPLLATSPYWPYVDVGTPMRVRVRSDATAWIGDTFTARTVASGWGTVETYRGAGGTTWLDPAGLSVSGGSGLMSFTATNTIRIPRLGRPHTDAVVRYDVTVPAVTTGAALAVGPVLRQNTSGSTYVWPAIELRPGGTVVWNLLTNSTYTSLGTWTQTGLTYSGGTTVRCEIELIGPVVRGRAWLASGTKPAAWTFEQQLTTNLTGDTYAGLQGWLYAGNTNTLPYTASIDNLTFSQPRYPRIEGYITDVRPVFEPQPDGTVYSTVQIDIGGVGSRLEKRDDADVSPLRRSLQQASVPPDAYWPCEDAQGALQAASAFPGGTAMLVNGPAVFAFDTGQNADQYLHSYGTLSLCSLAAGASLQGTISPAVGSTSWTVSAMAQAWAGGVGGSVTEIRMLEWATGGTFNRWALVQTFTGYQVRAYNDVAGTTTTVVTVSSGAVVVLTAYDVVATQSGGTITVGVYDNTVLLASGTVAGTLAGVSRVTANPDKVNTTASTDPYGIRLIFGHIMVHAAAVTSELPYYFDGSLLVRADQGWGYEYAHRRVGRLCTEEQIPYRVLGDPYTTGTTQLNVQQPAAFTPLLTAAGEAESGAIIYEDNFGYTMLPRSQRYNAAVALTVDMSTYRRSDGTSQADVLVPKLDARGPNWWTVKRTSGSEATAAAPAAYRLRRGTIRDSATLDVLYDSDCAQHANWRVHVYTDGTQANYPQLTLDLAANPGLIDDYLRLVHGDRVQRTNQPTVAGLGTIDQVIDQMSETLVPRQAGGPAWTAVLDCSPAAVWQLGVFDVARYDSQSSTLAAPLTTTTTSWSVTATALPDCWDQAAVPYDVMVGGERCTVTFASTPAGTGPYTQTLTCVRGVNGVVKAHTANESITVATPGRYAL